MIDKLEMFMALAREEHFGRAAESLGITQPSLSGGIKQLENQLGVQLVWRGSRYGGLTPEGQRVLIWARQIVGDVQTMRAEMRQTHKGLSGNLRLAVIPTALNWAADLTADFARAHPDVGFTVRSCSAAEVLAGIENLTADAGLTYLDDAPLGRVTQVPLYHETYALVCHRDHPLAGRGALDWRDLDGLPLCLLTPEMQNRRIISGHLTEAGITAQPMIQSNSTTLLLAHAETGERVTVLPQGQALALTAGRALCVVPLASQSAAQKAPAVGLIAPWREPHTPVLAALLDAARSLSAQQGD